MKKSIILLIALLALTSCFPVKNSKEEEEKEEEARIESIKNDPQRKHLDALRKIDLSKKPNEMGKIMVLMYHNIGQPEEEWVRTPENFMDDLETLYKKDYVPIRLEDYVKGNITTPLGKTPYVLTFDDSNENNLRYLEDGSLDPKCAVGVLLEFGKKHPDIKPYCSFFANGEVPFRVEGTEKEKVNFLLKNGFDLGNHTVNHPDLTQMNKEEVNYQVGHQARYLESLIDNKSYKIDTIALPFGSRPENEEAEKEIFSGNYDGFAYKNIAVLNVGWDPYFSPYSVNFNPMYIHRVRASETNVGSIGIYGWLEHFDNYPEERFISDGNPDIITVPEDYTENLNKNADKEVYVY